MDSVVEWTRTSLLPSWCLDSIEDGKTLSYAGSTAVGGSTGVGRAGRPEGTPLSRLQSCSRCSEGRDRSRDRLVTPVARTPVAPDPPRVRTG